MTLSGIVMFVNPLQPEKQVSLSEVMVSGIVMFVSPLQPKKQEVPIEVTVYVFVP